MGPHPPPEIQDPPLQEKKIKFCGTMADLKLIRAEMSMVLLKLKLIYLFQNTLKYNII